MLISYGKSAQCDGNVYEIDKRHMLVIVMGNKETRRYRGENRCRNGRSVGEQAGQSSSPYVVTENKPYISRAQFCLTFKRRIKSRLPFAGIIRSSQYSTRSQDRG